MTMLSLHFVQQKIPSVDDKTTQCRGLERCRVSKAEIKGKSSLGLRNVVYTL